MHEMTIAVQLQRTLSEIIEEQNITKIGSVTLEIGQVSGVVPSFLTKCWDFYKENYPKLKDSKLKIEMVTAYNYCMNCEETYEAIKYGKVCPYCNSKETVIATGLDCTIKEIEAETEDEVDETAIKQHFEASLN